MLDCSFFFKETTYKRKYCYIAENDKLFLKSPRKQIYVERKYLRIRDCVKSNYLSIFVGKYDVQFLNQEHMISISYISYKSSFLNIFMTGQHQ